MNNKQHVQLTKVTDYDFVSAEKDKYGVFYSRDGLRLIDVDNKTFSIDVFTTNYSSIFYKQ